MSSRNSFKQQVDNGRAQPSGARRVKAPALAHILTAASCAAAILSISACAAGPRTFNPDALADTQLARISGICQNVMGLSPSERLTGGYWLGNDRLDYWTSRYRGCVTSLSDSLQQQGGTQAAQQADRDCRAKGYATGSPDLALCVLQSSPGEQAGDAQAASQATSTLQPPQARGSLFYASPHETRRREEVACAALGLSPAGNAFGACVNNLDETFHAIDNPIT